MNRYLPVPAILNAIIVGLIALPSMAANAPRERCVAPEGTALIEFRSNGNHLRGFIDLPHGRGKHPAIMIVHGGLDTDVTAGAGFSEAMRNTFRRAGIATLVWDKAGNGCSSGKYADPVLPIRERATETLAALNVLRQRSDIDSSRIGLWALSQGAWVAPMAMVQTNDIAYLIAVSAPGRDALSQATYESLSILREAGVAESEAQDVYATLRRGVAVARATGSARAYASFIEPLRKYPSIWKTYGPDPSEAGQAAILSAPEWSINADEFLTQLRQPTLAVFGQRDRFVDWRESVDVYRDSFERSGNRDLTIKVFKDADHDMLAPAADPSSPQAVHVDGYMEAMVEWLKARNFAGR
ncbi:alpha/beta hydrolase family protein [Luteimonas salinilitoris]|uniref:Alpha/beta hydrolase family protein n=1 Tax=Luteimonas salinilitoris TaxID=3237697 RepID=A0ABV4HSB6_9GAMM